jgi:hypothetical protein
MPSASFSDGGAPPVTRRCFARRKRAARPAGRRRDQALAGPLAGRRVTGNPGCRRSYCFCSGRRAQAIMGRESDVIKNGRKRVSALCGDRGADCHRHYSSGQDWCAYSQRQNCGNDERSPDAHDSSRRISEVSGRVLGTANPARRASAMSRISPLEEIMTPFRVFYT